MGGGIWDGGVSVGVYGMGYLKGIWVGVLGWRYQDGVVGNKESRARLIKRDTRINVGKKVTCIFGCIGGYVSCVDMLGGLRCSNSCCA